MAIDHYKSRWCKCHRCPQGQHPCIGAECLWYGDNLVKSLMAAEDADARAGASKVRSYESRLRGVDRGDFQVVRGRDGEYVVTLADGTVREVKA